MYSEALLDHFRNPRNVGELPPPAAVVEVSNPVCGDILRLSASVKDGRIEEIRYKVRGCTASIGVGSALSERLRGERVDAIAHISADELESLVGGLPNESKHAARLCRDAIEALSGKFK